jgi:transmembrane sensor
MEEWNRIISRCLAGECTAAEKHALQEWRNKNIENDLYFLRLEEIWQKSAIEPETFTPDVREGLRVINDRIRDSKAVATEKDRVHRGLSYYTYRIAAVLTLGLCLAFAGYFLKDSFAPDQQELLVSATQSPKQKIGLSDGTIVWLNSNSTLRYPKTFSAETREVILEGEGYFEVVHNPEKPFIIHAGSSVTRVVGTAFNIRALPSEQQVVITVTTGKVLFTNRDQSSETYLSKGEQAVLTDNQGVIKENNPDVNFLSWQTGKIIFNNTSLEEVAKVLSRHYQTSITIDRRLSQCRLTSTFSDQSLEEVLDELATIQEMTISYTGKNITLHGKGC